MILYNRYNFYRNTYCEFTEVNSEMCSQSPNYVSKSGSKYIFTEEGVYRISNHWGRAAKCKWRLVSSTNSSQRTKAGFAKWSSFYLDNDNEPLYCIFVDANLSTVAYKHKEESDAANIYRTATETTKRIREIRNLLKNRKWLQHFPEGTHQEVLHSVVLEMINSGKPLAIIKSNLMRHFTAQS